MPALALCFKTAVPRAQVERKASDGWLRLADVLFDSRVAHHRYLANGRTGGISIALKASVTRKLTATCP
jgi:hypothetical protein